MRDSNLPFLSNNGMRRHLLSNLLSSHHIIYKDEKNRKAFINIFGYFVVMVVYIKTGKNGEPPEKFYFGL